MYKHIIPVNMMDNGNIGNGMLKKRNCIEAGIYAFLIFLALKVAAQFITMKTVFILAAIFGVGPTLLLVLGIGDESCIEALTTYIGYKKQKSLLRYSLAACLKEAPEEDKKAKKNKEKKAKEKAPKKTKEEKRKEKKHKKKEKAQEKAEKKKGKKKAKYEKKKAKLDKKMSEEGE